MAKEGLGLACVAALIAMATPVFTAPPDDRENIVASTLAVQTAMQQGREQLLRNNARAAVETLEGQLSRINGNPIYLTLLRDAYRAYVKELRTAKQESQAQVYLNRLHILEPEAAAKKSIFGAKIGMQLQPVAAVPTQSPAASPKPSIVRGYRQDDDDPFNPQKPGTQKLARELIVKAEEEFGRKQYRQANQLFEQAHGADQHSTDSSGERWAYCKLHQVVEELNHDSTAFPTLENEVKLALQLAPRLDYASKVLVEIEKRRKQTESPAAVASEPVKVNFRELGRTAEGWSLAETDNFRIFYVHSKEWAEQTANIAERTRTEMMRKWFGGVMQPWAPKCEIFLHPSGQEYSKATGAPASSPGHSSFRLDGGRVVGRRIDLHCDNPTMLVAVLPHEATHVVLAGNFGEQPVPRWADEGMAVLTEPREKIDRHLHNLPMHLQQGQLFEIRQLLVMNDYPEPQRIGAFYAQSVSVVEFLSKERGPQVFAQFVRDGLHSGYESAMQKHYGYRSFEEMEQHWRQYAFNASMNVSGSVVRGASN